MTRRACCGGLLGAAAVFLAACARPAVRPGRGDDDLGRGVALRGRVWPGGAAPVIDDGVVVVDATGTILALGPVGSVVVPEGLRVLGSAGSWVGPGIVDAHVHLAFGGPDLALAGGLVGVRDLGAPPALAARWRTPGAPPPGSPVVAVAGPLLTAPGGYPSRSWGANGFSRALDSPESARAAVRDLVADGVDLVKVALEPGGGLPVPTLAEVRAVVEAAHAAGLKVTAHALTVEMVERALDGGVDELCHVATEVLPAPMVERVAEAGVPVVSTLQTFHSGGDGTEASTNAAALVAAGVPLVYGTDLGNAGTRPGVDPRELERLADAGLGRLGALRAATTGAASVAGITGLSGRLAVGEPAHCVVLPTDPLVDPGAWERPTVLVTAGRLHQLS